VKVSKIESIGLLSNYAIKFHTDLINSFE